MNVQHIISPTCVLWAIDVLIPEEVICLGRVETVCGGEEGWMRQIEIGKGIESLSRHQQRMP